MLTYLVTIGLILALMAGWIAVQAAHARFRLRHPELGPARELGGGCGGCVGGGCGGCATPAGIEVPPAPMQAGPLPTAPRSGGASREGSPPDRHAEGV